MSETSGLSRRRVNTGPVSTSSSEPSSSTVTSHAGSAFAGGNKVAFDPRDLERDEEESKAGGKIPRLTLMEEVLLLGLKDRQASTPVKHPVSRLDLNAGLLVFLE
jgi:Golgi phosphoprotein 3